MMSQHLSRRREAFCQHYVRLGSGAQAAREAGYGLEQAKHQSYRLLRDAHVRARISEIDAERRDAAEQRQEEMAGRLEGIYREAAETGALGVAVRAIEAEARILGLARARLPDAGPLAGAAGGDTAEEPAMDADVADLMARAQAEVDDYLSGGKDAPGAEVDKSGHW